MTPACKITALICLLSSICLVSEFMHRWQNRRRIEQEKALKDFWNP
jgi:hypothetical protein